MTSLRVTTCLVLLALAASACQREPAPPAPGTEPAAQQPPPPPPPPPLAIARTPATEESIAAAEKDTERLADRDRRTKAALTFEEFMATVYREPWDGGKFIVNGDTPIANEKQLREFYEQNVNVRPSQAELTIASQTGIDIKWNPQQKMSLTYCVSNTFGARHDAVVQQMANAGNEWEKVASIDFTHVPAQDATCGPTNPSVVFDVRPVNEGEYLARAFFPDEPRAARNVLIDESSFELTPGENLQLIGILRHELGHTLGFRHEHTRPEAGTCFEDQDWRPLTSYDAFSVMHYPQCNGRGDWSLILTDRDKHATACVYGAASGFTVDQSLVNGPCATTAPPPTGQPMTQSITGQSVARGAQNAHGSFAVTGGSQLDVAIGGAGASGDPDLYVRFGNAPTVRLYDCRPYLDGPVETCSLTVPPTATRALVMVRGYTAGKYDLTVTHVPPATPGASGTK